MEEENESTEEEEEEEEEDASKKPEDAAPSPRIAMAHVILKGWCRRRLQFLLENQEPDC